MDPIGEPASSDKAPLDAAGALPLVYEQLRALARRRMADENAGHTLHATALVHEVYLRLADAGSFADRAHFFRTAAEAMRRILIEHARGKQRVKRGGKEHAARRIPLNVLDFAELPDSDDLLALDEAIEKLAGESPLAASVVQMRFYAGLSIDETAEALGISPRSVNREWTYARAWLFRALEQS
jgi:RNA polymerase sigma factor (TIGR02999 family)